MTKSREFMNKNLTTPMGPVLGSGAMFDRIAKRYDRVNRIISLGQDRRWRRKAIAAMQLHEGATVLDVATGTGPMMQQMQRTRDHLHLVGIDPSAQMLRFGKQHLRPKSEVFIEWIQGDGQHLPFKDAAFDAVCIAYGIRNVPNRLQALREMRRVLKPEGRLAILELSFPPPMGILNRLARFYIQRCVPRIGGMLSSASEYDYLHKSIAQFPSSTVFTQMIQEAGLEVLQVVPMTFGSCYLYVAKRVDKPT